MPSSSRRASACSSPMSAATGKLLGESASDQGLNGEIGDRDRRAVVLGESARDHFALNAAGQERGLSNGCDGELGFGQIEHH